MASFRGGRGGIVYINQHINGIIYSLTLKYFILHEIKLCHLKPNREVAIKQPQTKDNNIKTKILEFTKKFLSE